MNVPVRSTYETGARALSRDVGISVVLPDGHELWLFGDTAIFRRTGTTSWRETGFVDGSTAIEARYTRGAVPRGGDYPSGRPARFIPPPAHVYLPDGSGRPCTYSSSTYPARWPTGAAVMPGGTRSDVMVTYVDVCVTRPANGGLPRQRVEGWGYLLYNWRAHRISRGPVDVFEPQRNATRLADSRLLGSPYFHDHELTLFASHCISLRLTCAGGDVWSVTLPDRLAAINDGASYDFARLSTDGSGEWDPVSVSVGRYAGELRIVELTSVGGTYDIYSSPSISARWHLRASGTLPGCHRPRTGFCYALTGHPELSTSTRMFVSYLKPDFRPGGHLVVSAVPS